MVELTSKFNGNHQARNLFDYLNFTKNFDSNQNKNYSEKIQESLKDLQSNSEIKINVARLSQDMKEIIQCVVHGDFHSGSVLMKNDQIYIIDSECATIGPISYDVGILFGNILVGYLFQGFFGKDRKEYQNWILKTVSETWIQFQKKFISMWNETKDHKNLNENEFQIYQNEYFKNILKSTIGYMGVIILRSAVENWPEYTHLVDIDRDVVSCYIISAAKLVLKGGFESMDDVLNQIEKLKI